MPDISDSGGFDAEGKETAAIVVPFLNEADQLPELFRGIEAQERTPDQIVFVDAGSSDDGAEVVRRWCGRKQAEGVGCRLLEKPGAYPGAARNAGIDAAATDLVAFLDCGIVPDPGWLDALFCCMTPADAGVFGICRAKTTAAHGRFARWICTLSYGRKKRWIALPASMVRREVFSRIGGFREDLRSAEDLEWARRYEAKFGRRRVCPEAVIRYGNFPETLAAALNKWFSYARSTVRAGVMKKQQALLFGIWAALLALFLVRPAAGALLLFAYLAGRGLALPAVRSGWQAVFARPREVPVLLGLGLLLDLAKLAGFTVEYGLGGLRSAAARRKSPEKGTRQTG